MGYYSTVKGTIHIKRLTTPKLPSEILEELEKRGLKITSQYRGLSPDAVDKIDNIENLQGYITVTDRALQGTNESNKVYELDSGLRKALSIIQADGCHASGFLAIFGEEGGDIWRLRAEGENLFEEAALLTWPDGTKVDV